MPREQMSNSFSRRTVIAAIGVLERLNMTQLTRFLLELGPDFPRWTGNETSSASKKLNKLIGIYDQQPERIIDSNESLQEIIVQKAASVPPCQIDNSDSDPLGILEREQKFHRQLALDGFVVTGGALRRSLPENLDLPTAQDEINRLLDKHGFKTASGHLQQALDAHANGKWASSNSQIRTFLEALFDEIAVKIDPETISLKSGHPRRTQLAKVGFLSVKLNEWGNDGQGFIHGLMKRLHPEGSHPGLSDDGDSTFRLHMVLITARLMLTRFDKRP
jgi:hypothetical protein